MIKLDSYKGYNCSIKINSNKAPGMYKIKVKGTLPNNLNSIYQVFDIKITVLSLPKFLPEPLIVEIIEVNAG